MLPSMIRRTGPAVTAALLLAVLVPARAHAQVPSPVALTNVRAADASARFRDLQRYNALIAEANERHRRAAQLRAAGVRRKLLGLVFTGAGAYLASTGFDGEGNTGKLVGGGAATGMGLGMLLGGSPNDRLKMMHEHSEREALAQARALFPEHAPAPR